MIDVQQGGTDTDHDPIVRLEVRMDAAEKWLKSVDARLWFIVATTLGIALEILWKGHV